MATKNNTPEAPLENSGVVQPVRNLMIENISIEMPVKNLLFIGRTLQKNYIGADTARFNTKVNSLVNGKGIADTVAVEITVGELLNIVDILGAQSERYYTEQNKEVERAMLNSLPTIEDEEIRVFLVSELTERKAKIGMFVELYTKDYILENGLTITDYDTGNA